MMAVSNAFAPSWRPSVAVIGLASTDASSAEMVAMASSTVPSNGQAEPARQSVR